MTNGKPISIRLEGEGDSIREALLDVMLKAERRLRRVDAATGGDD